MFCDWARDANALGWWALIGGERQYAQKDRGNRDERKMLHKHENGVPRNFPDSTASWDRGYWRRVPDLTFVAHIKLNGQVALLRALGGLRFRQSRDQCRVSTARSEGVATCDALAEQAWTAPMRKRSLIERTFATGVWLVLMVAALTFLLHWRSSNNRRTAS